MNTTLDDGGPAWPSGKSETPGYENSLPYYEGMSLRDWMAGLALTNIGSNYAARGYIGPEAKEHADQIAAHAYNIADAMIAARKEAK